MKLIEKHIVKKSNSFYQELDKVCLNSKNLYNSILYIWRQKFTKDEKITLSEIYLEINKTPQFKQLPQNVSAQVFLQFGQVLNSFFKALASYKKNPEKFTDRPQIPKYKDSVTGRNIAIYNARVLPQREFKKDGEVRLTSLMATFPTKVKPTQVRIVPRNDYYQVELVYNKDCKEEVKSENFAGLDLGVNNLGALSFNNSSGILINGKPIKSINQYYNKQRAKLQSKNKKSKKLTKLTNKRNNKIKDYLHKASRFIVNQLVSKNISTLIIGANKMWKQDANIGKRNNQNFVSIPHAQFIDMIKYKCELEGIKVIITEESYTSKCSFIDFEPIKKHENYIGKREKRGLFVSEGRKINADLNGSLNILRKVVPNCFTNGIEGLVVSPAVFTVKL
jgi:putative transposase